MAVLQNLVLHNVIAGSLWVILLKKIKVIEVLPFWKYILHEFEDLNTALCLNR